MSARTQPLTSLPDSFLAPANAPCRSTSSSSTRACSCPWTRCCATFGCVNCVWTPAAIERRSSTVSVWGSSARASSLRNCPEYLALPLSHPLCIALSCARHERRSTSESCDCRESTVPPSRSQSKQIRRTPHRRPPLFRPRRRRRRHRLPAACGNGAALDLVRAAAPRPDGRPAARGGEGWRGVPRGEDGVERGGRRTITARAGRPGRWRRRHTRPRAFGNVTAAMKGRISGC